MASAQAFNVVETTVADIHTAYKAGTLTARQLVQMFSTASPPTTKKARLSIPSSRSIPKSWKRPIG